MRGARFLCVALLAGVAAFSASTTLRADPPVVYAYEEPGQPVISTRYADGVTEVLQTHVVTKPICGSNMHGISPAQFKQMAKDAFLNAAALPVTPIGDDLPTPHAGLTLNITV